MPAIDLGVSELETLIESHRIAIETKQQEIKAFHEVKTKEIDECAREIVVLQRRINSKAPIARIPAEVLVEILYQHRIAYLYHDSDLRTQRSLRITSPHSHLSVKK